MVGTMTRGTQRARVSCFLKPSRRLHSTSGLRIYFPRKQMSPGKRRRSRPLVLMVLPLAFSTGDFLSKLSPSLSKAGRKAAPWELRRRGCTLLRRPWGRLEAVPSRRLILATWLGLSLVFVPSGAPDRRARVWRSSQWSWRRQARLGTRAEIGLRDISPGVRGGLLAPQSTAGDHAL